MTITIERLITALHRTGRHLLAETIEFEAQAYDEVAWHPTEHDHAEDWPNVGDFVD